MVKHTQTIRRPLLANCLSVFDRLVGLALKVLTSLIYLFVCLFIYFIYLFIYLKRISVRLFFGNG